MITLHRRHFIALLVLILVFMGLQAVQAWTGPTQAPPNGNVSAPINVGTTDQVKNAGLSVNALAIFGNAILSGTSRYLNWGTTAGSGGYGLRDNVGTMEVKDSGGSWNRFATTTSTGAFNQVRFADGTTQATAAGASGAAIPVFQARDSQPAGTVGGSCSPAGTWITRILNTVVLNNLTGASLGSNRVTLPAGTYWIEWSAPGWQVGRFRSRLRNITAGSDIAYSETAHSWKDGYAIDHTYARGGSRCHVCRAYCY